MIETFTQFSRKLLNLSAQEANKLGHNMVDSEHMLIAISRQDSSLASTMLSSRGLGTHAIIEEVIKKNPRGSFSGAVFSYSEDLRAILSESVIVAKSLGFEFVSVDHVLISILGKRGLATVILNENNITQDDVINEVLSAKMKFDNIKQKIYDNLIVNQNQDDFSQRNIYKKPPKMGAFLDKFAVDITNKAENGELDAVAHREEEIQRVIQILSRRTKNNPILIGEPGVGKTSIINAIAQRIIDGNVPSILSGRRILRIDMPLVVSGSRFKGELEDRIRNILEEVKKNSNVILFIDNFHTIAILSGQESSAEAGNIIKNALAESDIQIIGATSTSEYKRYIEKDDVLKRRIQTIVVKEPTVDEAIDMIKTLKKTYELYHDVKIGDEVIELAVKLSKRYINDKYLPDKAIDLIDEASAKLKLTRSADYYKVDEIIKGITDARFSLNSELKESNMKNVSTINDKIDELDEIMSTISQDRLKKYNEQRVLDRKYIEQVISTITGIPLERLTKTQEDKLLSMQDNLSKYVIGQDSAVSSITSAILRANTGLKDPRRPIGSFIFVGSTGVGKTRLAKMLAKELFDDEEAMIRIDMSEYMEKFDVTKMIGSPPGYVGHTDGGQLTEKIKKRPYCVLLFDEIEKAHADIFDLLLQVLDEGHLTDSHGKKVDFKNTIIIMTSNIGASKIKSQKNLGFVEKDDNEMQEKEKEMFLSELKKYFKPEFINRVDEIVVFESLTKEDINKIVMLMVDDLNQRLSMRNIRLNLDEAAISLIADKGYSKEYGARQLQRSIQKMIEDELSRMILKKQIKDNDEVNITVKEEKLDFSVK